MQPAAPRIDDRLELREILCKRRMVGIEPIRLPGRHDSPGGDEPGDLVDVPVGVVANDAVTEIDRQINRGEIKMDAANYALLQARVGTASA